MKDFIKAIVDSRDVAAVRDTFLTATRDAGFAHAFYAARFSLSVPPSIVRDPPVTFNNLPGELLAQGEGLYGISRDAWVEWVLQNDGDITATRLIAQVGAERTPSLAMGARNGMRAVQLLSLRNIVKHSVGAIMLMPGLNAEEDDLARLWEQRSADMWLLARTLHMRVATLPREHPTLTLTTRQREVLSWRSAGKTVSEIGTILGITPATVEKHMRLAREALGVDTTPQAVLKAHVTDQLFHPAYDPMTLHLPSG
ncbi:helix-turn-helix transcriptional regulator [Paracoccus indicus]|uniref:helix-turn-helix transcriptional regulator n=1 Tax=Paracoccus indicus TaxID=2079229 RepID=UPI000D38D817|nr:helix-turn-helix transcriptional regulator [Paracoccus indicus]